MCKALEVSIDVSSMHPGRIPVDNTEFRKKELGDFIDCDARAESEKAPAGFAGPSGKTHQLFSFEVPGKDLDKLNPFGKKTAVFPCEFFAVLVAQSVWRDQLVNRQVVFYIDNDGVRDVLISCNTSDPVGHVMLTRVLELERALTISS